MFTRQPATSKTLADFKTVDKPFDNRTAPAARAMPAAHDTEPRGPAAPPSMAGGQPAQAAYVRSGPAPAGSSVSIIGNDLTIVGQGLRIITKGTLQVDGKVEGDVAGLEVIIGEKGSVTGVITGESVIVYGAVSGAVKAINVELRSGAQVEGDVHHHHLTVETGARLDARVRRPADLAELKPILD